MTCYNNEYVTDYVKPLPDLYFTIQDYTKKLRAIIFDDILYAFYIIGRTEDTWKQFRGPADIL